MSEHTFFVRLNNANKLRKAVLEFSRSVISLLKRFQYIQKIRQEKKQKMNELSSIFNEINQIAESLDFDIPDLSINDEDSSPPQEGEQPAENQSEDSGEAKISTNEEPADSDDEIKKIEESAGDIEKKINELL